jgi:hypothetical protein
MTCQQVIINSENQTLSLSVDSNATITENTQSTGTNETTMVDATDQLKFAIKFIKKLPKLEHQGEMNITSVTIPITFIVPIDIQSQNAQICLSILSSTDVNCQQIIINSNQTVSIAPITNGTNTTSAKVGSNVTNNNATTSNTEVNETDAAESDDEGVAGNSEDSADNETESDEPCVTPCPPDQYCVQMCQPDGNNTG